MLERDFLKTVVTRQITEGKLQGKWQFAVVHADRPLRFACGEYVSEKAAQRAAVRRHFR